MMSNLRKELLNKNVRVASQWGQFLSRQLSQLQEQENDKPIQANPFYEKYADKLCKAAATQNGSNPQQISKEEEQMKKKLDKLNAHFEPREREEAVNKSAKAGSSGSIRSKRLDDVVKVDLLQQHNIEEIKSIWCEHFREKSHTLFACIDSNAYERMKKNMQAYPIFLLPLPVFPQISAEDSAKPKEKANYQFILSQFDGDQAFFTPLIMYQTKGECAPVALTLTHYTELAESKQLILMAGEYDHNVLNSFQAQCLVNLMQIFYGNGEQKHVELLRLFNQDPANFNHLDIIQAFENLSLNNIK